MVNAVNQPEDEPVALVTGAATGVGRACAHQLARLGYRVVVNYLGPEASAADQLVDELQGHEPQGPGLQAMAVQCDVSRYAEVVAMVEQIRQTFARLDVVINCAGTTEFIEHADLEAMTEDIWDRILDVNVKGAFWVMRACCDLLRDGKRPAIVNVGSVAGLSGSGSSIAYCASKGALHTLTKSMARALAPAVRVNAVCPGPIDSQWLRRGMSETELAERAASCPIPRLSRPEEIADVILHLAIGPSMITGQLVVVDGGRTM